MCNPNFLITLTNPTLMVRVPFHEMTTAKVMLLFGSLGYIQSHCAGMKMATVPRLNYTIHNKN